MTKPPPAKLADHDRGVTLRELPADCLLDGALHPNIKDRLERIRQIPHPRVASLLSVERDESGNAWLLWDSVEGESFPDAASDPRRSPREVATFMRELVLAVESFHAAGLVHGALTDENVLVDRDGNIRLTGASALLHHDPHVDERAVFQMLRNVIARRGNADGALAQLIARQTPLRELRMGLAALVESPDAAPQPPIQPRAEMRLRLGALIAAAFVALAGVAVALGVYARLRSAMPKALAPPVLEKQR